MDDKDKNFEVNVGSIIEPMEVDSSAVVIIDDNNAVVEQNPDLDTDFNYTRENLYTVVETGNKALEELLDFARNSQSPRAYEVVDKLLNTIAATSEKIIDNHQKIININSKSKGSRNKNGDGSGVTNNVFIGTTEQLFDALEKNKKK